MKNCLNERTLMSLHDGEGSAEERAHVESCLNCARRYRQLTDDIKDVVTILRQAPSLSVARKPAAYPGLRWSLAAGLVMGAFLLGRMTTAGTLRLSHGGNMRPDQVASAAQGPGQAGVGSGYGLYIESLIGQEDETDSGQVTAEDTWNTDSDGL